MARFKYVGDPAFKHSARKRDAHDPEVMHVGKYMFDLNGDAVEVEDKALAEKLRGNNHFEEVGGAKSSKRAASSKYFDSDHKFDPNLDGLKAGSQADSGEHLGPVVSPTEPTALTTPPDVELDNGADASRTSDAHPAASGSARGGAERKR